MKSMKAPRRRAFRGIAHEDRLQLRREQLIEAGIEAFGTRGYHAVTVREICAGARLTERYFYESFHTLEDLFVVVYAHLNGQLKQATLTALALAPRQVPALAEAALRVLLTFIHDDPRRARIILIDAVAVGHDVQKLAAEINRDYTELLRGFIDTLFPRAKEMGANVDIIAAGLLGANIHIATQWVRGGFVTPMEEVLHNNLAIYLAMSAYFGEAAGGTTVAPAARRTSK